MARATRSTATQEKEKTAEPSQIPRKNGSRKRKRNSLADGADQPVAKQSRVDDDIKEESTPDPEEPQPADTTQPDLPSSGDVPIHPQDAEKILEILEMVDTQGLLDRVFPLPTEDGLGSDSAAGPSTGTQSYSFRALLKSPSMYPIRVLRSAVQHLFPISSHPRSRPSATAAEQLRFCNLALSLLDQASFHYAPIPLGVESLTSGHEELPATVDGEETKFRPARTRSPARQRKYALVQRLPTGDWWSSIGSSYPSLATDGKDLKDLPTAYADLVAIIPAPSTTLSEPPTLGSYVKKSLPKPRNDLTAPRQITCGRFLDYGPYTSFAPDFEQDGVEVGRVRLAEVIWFQERDARRTKMQQEAERLQLKHRTVSSTTDEVAGQPDVIEVEPPGTKQKLKEMDVDVLEGLLSPEQISSLKAALGSLELENAVQELLDRNSRALERLEELQFMRLHKGNGTEPVEVGSEEWDIAQGIYDSLTLLASLRPRSSHDADTAPLIPTASALHKLHRTLPLTKTEGWYGTLPPGRASALRDDTTIHIKAGVTVTAPAPVPTPVVATPATPAAVKTPTPAYGGYAYPGYPSAQYRGNYPNYPPGQGGGYFAGYPGATAHTPQAQYATQYGATGQQPYSYSSWYNYQPPPPAAGPTPGSAAPSGRATPQTPVTAAPGYPGYYPTPGTQQPQPQRAVANTVLSAAAGKAYQAGWTNGGTPSPYVPPTLPPHLRAPAAAGSMPGTPTPTSTAATYQSYYAAAAANYQPAPTAAR